MSMLGQAMAGQNEVCRDELCLLSTKRPWKSPPSISHQTGDLQTGHEAQRACGEGTPEGSVSGLVKLNSKPSDLTGRAKRHLG